MVETEKERISRNEGDDHFAFLDQPAVFRKDGIYRSLDFDPYRISGQERLHNLVMPLPSGEDIVVFDTFDNDFYMLRLWIVVHPDHIDVCFAVSLYNFLSSHTSLPGFNCSASL